MRSHFCSMEITRDVRVYAAKRGMGDAQALAEGLREKPPAPHSGQAGPSRSQRLPAMSTNTTTRP
ncbi:hypothetical protein C1I98_10620 [Spongiactinospora gelatinilytica]|uniref:Uncharacterized protein n=1 Tax=Spongiactinospora gelatinilytica TaxID=2666298 RepID=A0A2W2HWM7_9ACTN|nr:hypothetical protein C1I98_10620 [Spongiactinospora gelatinilytica]